MSTIFLHDYAGHPFQAELSRALATRGHTVVHAFFAGDPGPKGDLELKAADPATLSFLPIEIGAAYQKENLIRRRFQDLEYGRATSVHIERLRPDIVISGNTPTEAQDIIVGASKRAGARFVFWCQDFYSVAIEKLLSRKIPVAGALVASYYGFLERRQMRAAAATILITEDFLPLTHRWGVEPARTHVVRNWGAIEQIPVRPKDNAWSQRHDLADKKVVLYSGTIGQKHNPGRLIEIAERHAHDPKVRVVVVASGTGVAALRAAKADRGLDNLVLLGLQPFQDLPDVLGAADVLAAVIEPDAGAFSVPSKVLSYLCAGRPILLAAPAENLAARMLTTIDAGIAVDPRDAKGWSDAADRLLGDVDLRKRLADAGRTYAESNFKIATVADRFETIISAAMHGDDVEKSTSPKLGGAPEDAGLTTR